MPFEFFMWQSSRNVINTILLPHFLGFCLIVVCGSAAFTRTTPRQGIFAALAQHRMNFRGIINFQSYSQLSAIFPSNRNLFVPFGPVKMFVKYNKFPACVLPSFFLFFSVIFGSFNEIY